MVERVYGTANGQTILFDRTEGGRREATVPFCDDGEYVAEIYADDTAGNTGYMCTMLFVISGHELRGYIVPRGYRAEVKIKDYTGFQTIQEFFAKLKKMYFKIEVKVDEYTCETAEWGYKIERIICGRDDL